MGPLPGPRYAHMTRREGDMVYNPRAAKRPVNLSLNEDLVQQVRQITGNLSAQVETLLAAFLEAEKLRQAEADTTLAAALSAWNTFGEQVGSFAEEHSTL